MEFTWHHPGWPRSLSDHGTVQDPWHLPPGQFVTNEHRRAERFGMLIDQTAGVRVSYKRIKKA
jgi:hypothetical protein